MFLVQLLIPLADNSGKRFPERHFTTVSAELSAKFGGLTAFTRSPAVGLWREDADEPPQRDDIVVYEVLVDEIDRDWWAGYRGKLEQRLDQEELIIRAHEVQRL